LNSSASKPAGDPDPYGLIKVDSSQFPKDVQDALWLYFDGPCGECGGEIQMTIGTFMDILEAQHVIKPGGIEE